MKTHRYTYLAVFALMGCLLFAGDSFAQRGRDHRGGRSYRPNNNSINRSYSYNRPNYSNRSYPNRSFSNRSYSYNRYAPYRSYSYHRPNYSYRSYSYRSYAYNRPFISLSFGGNPYRYQGGYFYRPYGSVFRISAPPFGISITTLPIGYRSFYVGPDPYYYYNGIYYRSAPNSQYQVVAPPLGAIVDELPPNAKVAVIDGQKFYEADGTYYQENINAKNELEYTVVGTDGVLETDADQNMDNSEINDAPEPVGPQVGDRFDSLPLDAKAVVIRGEKLYSSPSGLFYKEVVEGNKVTYEVVGK